MEKKVVLGEYKGKPILSLYREDDNESKYPFSFGQKKAQMIVQNFEEIKRFAQSNADSLTTTGIQQ